MSNKQMIQAEITRNLLASHVAPSTKHQVVRSSRAEAYGIPVRKMDMQGNRIMDYKNVSQLETQEGFNAKFIRDVCNGHQGSYKGFKFMFLPKVV